jgi:FtsZ-interacting cell division protein ZipA
MSIPERLSRIVRHKFSEMKDRFDQMDEDALLDPAEIERVRRAQARSEAKQELQDSLTEPFPPTEKTNPKVDLPRQPLKSQPKLRTPQQITSPMVGNANSLASTNSMTQQTESDPLDYHYRMLGLDPGADFGDVQTAYNGLAARTEPGRFPAGSAEARELEDIRKRLDVSFRALRDSLDSTAHRFGLLEFDSAPADRASSKG